MTAIAKILAGGIGLAALAGAAPAAAQHYPGNQGYGGGGIGAIIDAILGSNRSRYRGVNSQQVINQCTAAVQQRLSGGYGSRYGGYGNPYGAYGGGYGGGRVLSVYHADRHGSTIRVRGYASSGANAAYGGYGGYGGYNPYGGGAYAAPVADLKFRCDVDRYGRIRKLNISRNRDVHRR
jgi:hypothetical protein